MSRWKFTHPFPPPPRQAFTVWNHSFLNREGIRVYTINNLLCASKMVKSPSHTPTYTFFLEEKLLMAGDAQRQKGFQEIGKKLLTEYPVCLITTICNWKSVW